MGFFLLIGVKLDMPFTQLLIYLLSTERIVVILHLGVIN